MSTETIKQHPSGCVEMTANGLYDVIDSTGKSLLDSFGGPFHTAEAAQATQRMFAALDSINKIISQINQSLRVMQ